MVEGLVLRGLWNKKKGGKRKKVKKKEKTQSGGLSIDCLRFRVRGYGLNLSGE